MTQPPVAVIFDLDGVLFDSLPANIALYNHLLAAVGHPQVAQDYPDMVHREALEPGLRKLLGDEALLRKALDIWRSLDPTPFILMSQLFPGAQETLGALAGRHRLAVATNRTLTAERALDHHGLLHFFEAVFTPHNTGVHKPDPHFLAFALARLGLAPEQVVYVGDSQVDQAVCDAHGVRLVAFRNPELTAWRHLDHLPDLLELWGA